MHKREHMCPHEHMSPRNNVGSRFVWGRRCSKIDKSEWINLSESSPNPLANLKCTIFHLRITRLDSGERHIVGSADYWICFSILSDCENDFFFCPDADKTWKWHSVACLNQGQTAHNLSPAAKGNNLWQSVSVLLNPYSAKYTSLLSAGF